MRKYFIILFILATSLGKSFCQVNPVWNVPSPEIASLGTYGQIPISYYTGIPNISIPVYEIKLGKYSFPISINYHLASVKPQAQGGCLGLGWNLIAGGYITRTVRGGVYDEKCDSKGNPHGYYAFAKHLKNADINKIQTENDSIFIANDIQQKYHEISADEFSFSFFGYSGNFYYNSNGQWTVVSDQDIKVEFNEKDGFVYLDQVKQRINCRGWNNADNNNRFFSKFTLITPDGCRYEFGGLDAIEFSVPYYGRFNADLVATTWRLSKITTPDHRTINFTYDTSALLCNINYEPQLKVLENIDCTNINTKNYGRAAYTGFLQFPVNIKTIETQNETLNFEYSIDYGYESRFLNDALYWQDASSFKRYSNYSTMQIVNTFGLFLKNEFVESATDIKSQLKNNILHCIQINKGVGSRTFYFDYTMDNRRKLSLFTVREGIPELIKKYKMNPDTQEQILYYEIPLNETKNAQPEYKFNYNTDVKFPLIYSLADTDTWGYYNGKNVVLSQSPELKVTQPNYAATIAEVLTDIVYPTGGRTCFDYELHNYSKQVARNLSSVESLRGYAGGLRVSKITNKYFNNAIENIKKFYYSEDKSLPSKSSGIAMREICVKESYKLGNGYIHLYSKGGISTPITNQNTPYVGYSSVIEETLDDKGNSLGYTRFRYTNYDTDIQGHSHFDDIPTAMFNNSNIGGSTPYSSNSEERGKLLCKEIYDATGILKNKVEYKYERVKKQSMPTVTQRCLNICESPYNNYFICPMGWLTNTQLYSYLPIEEKEVNYFHGDSIVNMKSMTYDDYKQMTSRCDKTGNLSERKTLYKYPYNESSYKWANKLHILSPVLSTTVSEKNHSQTEKNDYSVVNDIPYISKSITIYNEYTTKENYKVNLVDNYGNPIEIESDGMLTVLVWGNKGQTLRAKIENSSYENAKYQLGCSTSNYIDIDYLIANRHKLPSAHITIYRYDNALRLISVTSPNGVTEYYAYDCLDRLRKEYYLDNTDGNNTNRTRKKYGYGYNNGK